MFDSPRACHLLTRSPWQRSYAADCKSAQAGANPAGLSNPFLGDDMKSNSETKYVGMSATSLLGVAFVVLKLTGYIDWSWWWVLAPFWIPVALLVILLVVYLAIK